jgi:hypothetical protein
MGVFIKGGVVVLQKCAGDLRNIELSFFEYRTLHRSRGVLGENLGNYHQTP